MNKKPVAALITGINEIKFLSMKKIHEGFFIDSDYGVFQTDPTKALRYDKQAIYFYDIRSAKPLNMLSLKDLQDFINQNGLERITKKDVKHGGLLRRATKKHNGDTKKAMEELKQDELKQGEQVHNEIEAINKELKQKNDELKQSGEPGLKIQPDDYAGYVIEALITKNLITRGEAASIKFNLVSGKITIDDFIKQLEGLHKITIHQPITANAQYFVEDYRTFIPSEVMAYIKAAKGLGKDIKELGQPVIKNLIPLKYILVGLIGVAIFALVISNVNLNQFKNLLPF